MKRPGIVRALFLGAESLVDDLPWLVAGNAIFGACLLPAALAAQASLLGVLAAVPLSLPAAGVMSMATAAVRRGSPRLADFRRGLRRPLRTMGLATAQLLAVLLLALDAAVGWSFGSLGGALLTIGAAYALVALWTFGVVAWPLVLDPRAEARPLGASLRLAGLLLLARPLPAVALAALVALLLALSVASVVIVLSFGVALLCLVAAHWVLPAADELRGG